MPRSRLKLAGRAMLILLALVALIGVVIVLGNLSTGSSRRAAEAKYSAIKPGMTRSEVRRLVLGQGEEVIMLTGIGPVELMHIDDARYLIAVYYQPDPKDPSPTTYPNGVPHDNWVVREKLFLELGRTGTVDQIMTGFRLKPARSFDRTTWLPK